jgi:hypothetical protein
MQNAHKAMVPTNQVVALFADRALSFSLSDGASFAQLAESLSDMCEWRMDVPRAVSLKFGRDRKMSGVHRSGA